MNHTIKVLGLLTTFMFSDYFLSTFLSTFWSDNLSEFLLSLDGKFHV